MLKTIKQYHDKDVEGIKCTCYVIALEKKKATSYYVFGGKQRHPIMYF